MKIEQLQEVDFEAVAALIKELAEFSKTPEKMLNSAEKMKAEKDSIRGFVAKDDNGKVVAYTIFCFAYYTWTGKALYMDDLYVMQDHRSGGIGRALINKVIEYAKAHNCNTLRWQVSNWNQPAIEFYKKLGAEINEIEMNCDLTLK